MSLLKGIPFIDRLTYPRQVQSDSWEERSIITKSDVNLFCWKREANQQITEYLVPLLQSDLEPITFFSKQKDLQDLLSDVRVVWDQKSDTSGDSFWEDVYLLAADFLSFSNRKEGTVVLKVIENDACTKFHTDGYALRLFTTYYGHGTEWLPEKATNRKGLGKSNDIIVKDPARVQQMDTFEVGILKGELPHQPNSTRGIVHRSPEIGETRKKRIILRVDI